MQQPRGQPLSATKSSHSGRRRNVFCQNASACSTATTLSASRRIPRDRYLNRMRGPPVVFQTVIISYLGHFLLSHFLKPAEALTTFHVLGFFRYTLEPMSFFGLFPLFSYVRVDCLICT